MDGYAVRHVDLAGASSTRPVRLILAGEVAAGGYLARKVRRGEAIRIMTGAPLPPGADCVIPVEQSQELDRNVFFSSSPLRLSYVRQAGSEIRRGQLVLSKGDIIGPSQIAMLAFLDRPKVRVFRRPRVGVISTGDELTAVGVRRKRGQIPDSNRYGLLGLIESAGCTPVNGGRVGDHPESLLARIRKILPGVDFIVTSGGVSAGDYDVVKILFLKLGGVSLYRLPIKPGKPQAYGKISGIPFFGLPGNPVSSMVVFDFLVRPALRKMAGAGTIEMPRWRATVARDFPKKTRGWEFPRAIAREANGRWTVRPVSSQKSSNLKSMTDADGYLVLTPQSPLPQQGAEVVFVPLPV